MTTDAEKIISKDGTEIYVRKWLPRGAARAVVVLVHGLKAHSGLYEWPANEMAKAGFAVYALDLRGHGNSGGAPLYAAAMSDYVEDVRATVRLVKMRHTEPVFMLESKPTVEPFAKLIFDMSRHQGLDVIAVRVWETPTSFAEYRD